MAHEEMEASKLSNERANLRDGSAEDAMCVGCRFFQGPNNCQVVEGPVAKTQTCDWVQYDYDDKDKHDDDSKVRPKLEENEIPFLWEILKNQPQTTMVKDIAMTPVGWLILETDKVGKYWSKKLDAYLGELGRDHHWTQALVDGIIRAGKAIKIKPPTTQEEASKQFGDGDMELNAFKKFMERK